MSLSVSTDYSMISRTARFFSLVALALRIVGMARAVRPCLPMTLPMSAWATRSSSTVTCSPSISVTCTFSMSSTRAFAMSSTNSRMMLLHSCCVPHAATSCCARRRLLRFGCRRGDRDPGQEALDGVGGLRALAHPRLDLGAVDHHRGRFRQRGVVSEDLDEPSVAGGLRVRHHHAIGRLA